MLRHMDAHGVDRSLLIPYPVVEDVRAEHDLIAAAVRAHPDRFTGSACIPPYAPEFQDEVRRCAEELGFRALKLQPQYHGLNPVSRRSEFFFEAALRYKLAVVVHTGAGAPFACRRCISRPRFAIRTCRSCSDTPAEGCMFWRRLWPREYVQTSTSSFQA